MEHSTSMTGDIAGIFSFIMIVVRYVAGCIQVCDDMDGCNMAHRVHWLHVGWGLVIGCHLLRILGSFNIIVK